MRKHTRRQILLSCFFASSTSSFFSFFYHSVAFALGYRIYYVHHTVDFVEYFKLRILNSFFPRFFFLLGVYGIFFLLLAFTFYWYDIFLNTDISWLKFSLRGDAESSNMFSGYIDLFFDKWTNEWIVDNVSLRVTVFGTGVIWWKCWISVISSR